MTPIPLDLPSGARNFRRLVLDFTGTLSVDGSLLPGVGPRLAKLARELEITVLTADTFGTARKAVADLPVEVTIIRDGGEKAPDGVFPGFMEGKFSSTHRKHLSAARSPTKTREAPGSRWPR